jgi:hypothetical protein
MQWCADTKWCWAADPLLSPIPSSGSITCTINGYSYGQVRKHHSNTNEFTGWADNNEDIDNTCQRLLHTWCWLCADEHIHTAGCGDNNHNNTNSDTADRVQQLEKKETSRTTGSTEVSA